MKGVCMKTIFCNITTSFHNSNRKMKLNYCSQDSYSVYGGGGSRISAIIRSSSWFVRGLLFRIIILERLRSNCLSRITAINGFATQWTENAATSIPIIELYWSFSLDSQATIIKIIINDKLFNSNHSDAVAQSFFNRTVWLFSYKNFNTQMQFFDPLPLD